MKRWESFSISWALALSFSSSSWITVFFIPHPSFFLVTCLISLFHQFWSFTLYPDIPCDWSCIFHSQSLWTDHVCLYLHNCLKLPSVTFCFSIGCHWHATIYLFETAHWAFSGSYVLASPWKLIQCLSSDFLSFIIFIPLLTV